jgi:RNA recognition motif-containing protein
MGKKLYVGNLPFSATDQILTDTFSQCGTVASAKIIIDRDTSRSKGFGFVEMSTDAEATDAISKFNGADYDGRAMTVNEARPMVPRESRGGFGGGSGGNRDRGSRY